MIAEIGIMIGAYIITRMTSLIGQKTEGKVSVTEVFAAITILVTAFICFDLFVRGLTASAQLPRL